MTKWPNTIPYDLRCQLEAQDELRFTKTPQDKWAVFKEWLETHGIEPPGHTLPYAPEIEPSDGH